MELLKWAAQEVINSVKVSKRSREGNNEVWNNFGENSLVSHALLLQHSIWKLLEHRLERVFHLFGCPPFYTNG